VAQERRVPLVFLNSFNGAGLVLFQRHSQKPSVLPVLPFDFFDFINLRFAILSGKQTPYKCRRQGSVCFLFFQFI
jgi:hypothetical protein